MREMRDTLRSAFRRVLRLENRRSVVRQGRLERMPAFASNILGNARDITVYLPPGYDEHGDRRYPVLYMQDGQNLFEPERAFIPGQHWQLREAADHAIGERTIEPVIIAGIDNAGEQRLDEYTHVRDEAREGGGRAQDYAAFLLQELKPVIDQRFRSAASRTSVGGSSLGGLLSLHLALAHSSEIESAAVMSPSVWWGDRAILSAVAAHAGARPRIWLDIGGREGSEALADARVLRNRLMERGWTADNLEYFEDRRADHSERAWAGRARAMLEYLFPLSAAAE